MSREELEKLLHKGEETEAALEDKEEVLTNTSPNIPTSTLVEKVHNDDRGAEVMQEDSNRD